MNQEKGADFHIEGYDLHYVNRTNKRGGGVALFVDRDLKSKPVTRMTTVVDDLMECLTVEIQMEKIKNIVLRCVQSTRVTCGCIQR